MFMSSLRDKFMLSKLVCDKFFSKFRCLFRSFGFRSPCWCPVSRHQHVQHGVSQISIIHLGKSRVSPNLSHMKNCTDLSLGEGLWVFRSFHFSVSGLDSQRQSFQLLMTWKKKTAETGYDKANPVSSLTTEGICYLAPLLEFSIVYTSGAARLCLQLLFCFVYLF